MKRVLVLDANQRSALATTRSLGNHAIEVYTADESPCSLAGSSKHSIQYFSYPPPSTNTDKFIDALVHIINEFKIQLIMPMTELTTLLLLENEDRLNNIILPFSNKETINSLASKCNLMHLADKLNIPFPPTFFESGSQNASINFDDKTYPLVLKPEKSWVINDNKWIHTEVKFAYSATEAKQILSNDPAFNHPFMIQTCVSGHGEGVFSLYDQKKPITFFRHKRIREKPPWGGVSVVSESAKLDPMLQKYAQLLLDDVGWHGIAMVEFKVDDDGTAYLMEVNTRFWGSLQLAIDSGVDFPWLLYQTACGIELEPLKDYSTGNRLRWILGDFDSLYIYIKSNKYSAIQKLKRLFMFFVPSLHKTKHETNRWHDLGPFKWEVKKYFKDLI